MVQSSIKLQKPTKAVKTKSAAVAMAKAVPMALLMRAIPVRAKPMQEAATVKT
jgi:hypothetical protein